MNASKTIGKLLSVLGIGIIYHFVFVALASVFSNVYSFPAKDWLVVIGLLHFFEMLTGIALGWIFRKERWWLYTIFFAIGAVAIPPFLEWDYWRSLSSVDPYLLTFGLAGTLLAMLIGGAIGSYLANRRNSQVPATQTGTSAQVPRVLSSSAAVTSFIMSLAFDIVALGYGFFFLFACAWGGHETCVSMLWSSIGAFSLVSILLAIAPFRYFLESGKQKGSVFLAIQFLIFVVINLLALKVYGIMDGY